MEKLRRKRDKFIRALNALERSMQFFADQQPVVDIRIEEILIASLVKHFELCYEMAWKFLKQLLEVEYDTQVNSPKKIFRECFSLNLIDDKATQVLLAMAEARNATTHDYNEEVAQEIFTRLHEYLSVFEVLKKLAS